MGEGASALAMEMSDVTLMDSNLEKLVYVIKMGSRVTCTIQENISFSLVSKLLVVCLTFFGKMTLLAAIASDVGVMLLVTLNGMKLLPATSKLEARVRRRLKSPQSTLGEYDEVLGSERDDSDGEFELQPTSKSKNGDDSSEEGDFEIV